MVVWLSCLQTRRTHKGFVVPLPALPRRPPDLTPQAEAEDVMVDNTLVRAKRARVTIYNMEKVYHWTVWTRFSARIPWIYPFTKLTCVRRSARRAPRCVLPYSARPPQMQRLEFFLMKFERTRELVSHLKRRTNASKTRRDVYGQFGYYRQSMRVFKFQDLTEEAGYHFALGVSRAYTHDVKAASKELARNAGWSACSCRGVVGTHH
jgi:hypothetical protein